MFSIWYSSLLLLMAYYTGSNLLKSSAELLVSYRSRSFQDKNIFILAGQSNMAGRGGVFNDVWDGIIPSECKPNPSIIRFNSHHKWDEAQEPLHIDIDSNKTCGVGPGMAFANTLLQKMDSGTIGLVPCAIGGTRVSEWARGNRLYNMLIARSLLSLMEGGRIQAVLWYQGESDTVSVVDAESYGDNLKKFISDFRADLHLPLLPFIQVALASTEGPYKGILRKAQLEMDLPNVWTVDADGLLLGPDGIHLSTRAQVHLGRMLAEAYLTRNAHRKPRTFTLLKQFCGDKK
ncbi:hypothetical protein MKW92_026217 [Papaver armeniacum]|nr:hypothetical protein MKW92_026217 [Papaver armeniacum]